VRAGIRLVFRRRLVTAGGRLGWWLGVLAGHRGGRLRGPGECFVWGERDTACDEDAYRILIAAGQAIWAERISLCAGWQLSHSSSEADCVALHRTGSRTLRLARFFPAQMLCCGAECVHQILAPGAASRAPSTPRFGPSQDCVPSLVAGRLTPGTELTGNRLDAHHRARQARMFLYLARTALAAGRWELAEKLLVPISDIAGELPAELVVQHLELVAALRAASALEPDSQ
jgi:hypothetical protein